MKFINWKEIYQMAISIIRDCNPIVMSQQRYVFPDGEFSISYDCILDNITIKDRKNRVVFRSERYFGSQQLSYCALGSWKKQFSALYQESLLKKSS